MRDAHESTQRTGTAHVLISRTCVNECVFCATATKRSRREFPSREEIVQFVRDCARGGVEHLIFSGLGEPTLDPHWEEYLTLAGSLGFRSVCLFTNGFGMTEAKARSWRAAGLTNVLLSMHGMEAGHDRNVGRAGSFCEAETALALYAGAGYEIAINTCLTRHNLDEIIALRALLRRFPITSHTLAFPEWSGGVLANPRAQITYDEVAERAGVLVPSEDGITVFDNVPYCIVERRIREMQGGGPIEYLDGHGALQVHPQTGKKFLDGCRETPCPLSSMCPGFEAGYIEMHGWGTLPERVEAFLRRREPSLPQGARAEQGSSPSPVSVAGETQGARTREDGLGVDFPREMIVSIPAGTTIAGEASVAVRLDRRSSCPKSSIEAFGGRLAWVEADVEGLDASHLDALAGRRLRARARSTDLPRVAELIDEFHAVDTVFAVEPDDKLLPTVNFLTALGFPVHVVASSEPSADDGPERVCHAYLHSPTLRVPIEPFHTLLLTVMDKVDLSLWQTEFEDWRRNGYVTQAGRVSLSARFSDRGGTYGSLNEEWSALQRSDLYRELSLFPEVLFRRKSPCVLCSHLKLCGGFLRAIDRTARCEPWKRAFDLLRDEANRARRILGTADTEQT